MNTRGFRDHKGRVRRAGGQPLNVGRKRRTVSTAMRRALWARDRGCRFPGCNNKRFLDAHHVMHWAEGGSTSVDNTVLLCPRHHRLTHEGHYLIKRDRQGNLYFQRPDGRAVPSCGYSPGDMVDDDIDNEASEKCVRKRAAKWVGPGA